ncbi:MAG: hypothetical protein KF810_08595 [Rhizobiaceae bacterium]|nr:hypothetical protein [Rhizobiaceae bacterium]
MTRVASDAFSGASFVGFEVAVLAAAADFAAALGAAGFTVLGAALPNVFFALAELAAVEEAAVLFDAAAPLALEVFGAAAFLALVAIALIPFGVAARESAPDL